MLLLLITLTRVQDYKTWLTLPSLITMHIHFFNPISFNFFVLMILPAVNHNQVHITDRVPSVLLFWRWAVRSCFPLQTGVASNTLLYVVRRQLGASGSPVLSGECAAAGQWVELHEHRKLIWWRIHILRLLERKKKKTSPLISKPGKMIQIHCLLVLFFPPFFFFNGGCLEKPR